MRSLKTQRALNNEKRLQRTIKEYDHLLDLNYSQKEGYYYISRPFDNYDEAEASTVLAGEASIFAEALRKKHVVICHPIPVCMMEEWEIVRRNVMRHLHDNDLRKMGSTPQDRIKNTENGFDDESKVSNDRLKRNTSDEVKAYGRDYFRHKIQTKSYFGGMKRFQEGVNG